jgi:imidazole glycerol-phosphate synthase subunit HisH
MVVVVDYGVGNIGSILNMLKRLGVKAVGSASAAEIASADRLILPGVGSFDTAMQKLQDSGSIAVIRKRVFEDRVPILGICLGMHLLTRGSEEGARSGLEWIEASVVRFRREKASEPIRIPHMGWNTIRLARPHPLFKGLEENARFYFVHSFHAECGEETLLSTTTYGYPFASAVVRENILGVQFHPEKSHKFGFQLLRNFVDL